MGTRKTHRQSVVGPNKHILENHRLHKSSKTIAFARRKKNKKKKSEIKHLRKC